MKKHQQKIFFWHELTGIFTAFFLSVLIWTGYGAKTVYADVRNDMLGYIRVDDSNGETSGWLPTCFLDYKGCTYALSSSWNIPENSKFTAVTLDDDKSEAGFVCEISDIGVMLFSVSEYLGGVTPEESLSMDEISSLTRGETFYAAKLISNNVYDSSALNIVSLTFKELYENDDGVFLRFNEALNDYSSSLVLTADGRAAGIVSSRSVSNETLTLPLYLIYNIFYLADGSSSEDQNSAASSIPTDGIGILYIGTEDGEPSWKNATVLKYRDVSFVITDNGTIPDTAEVMLLMDDEGYKNLAHIDDFSDTGLSVYVCDCEKGINITDETILDLEGNQPLIYCGIENITSTKLLENVVYQETKFSGFFPKNGNFYVKLSDPYNTLFVGSAVYTEDGSIVGILTVQDEESLVCPIDVLKNYFDSLFED